MAANVQRDVVSRLRDELVQYHRLALLGGVTSAIAHELNNLMTPVLARGHDALSRNDPAALYKTVSVTVAQVTRALEMTQRLLDLARPDGPETRPHSVAEAVKNALDAAVRPLAKDAIEVVIDVPPGLCVAAQPLLLEQCLLSLMQNARAAAAGRPGRIAIRAQRNGDRASIRVADSFGRFKRRFVEERLRPFLASRAGDDPCDWQGLGAGLNAVRLIVQSHGGEIDAVLEDGETVFQISWPAVAAEPELGFAPSFVSDGAAL